MVYLQLFWVFFKIGLLSFGGGYAMLPMMRREVVAQHGWISGADFADIVAISQVMPGPISINCAVHIGYSAVHSPAGAVIATLALILPSFMIMLAICIFLYRLKQNNYVQAALAGLRPAVVGLIAAAAMAMMNADNFNGYKSVLIFAGACLSAWLFKVNPLVIILAAAAMGIFLFK
jgi:chromate transporter